jgi:hypothetical protein
MSSEPLERQILADHLGCIMMMGTVGNRVEGNEGEHRTSTRWGVQGGGALGRQGWEVPGLG